MSRAGTVRRASHGDVEGLVEDSLQGRRRQGISERGEVRKRDVVRRRGVGVVDDEWGEGRDGRWRRGVRGIGRVAAGSGDSADRVAAEEYRALGETERGELGCVVRYRWEGVAVGVQRSTAGRVLVQCQTKSMR